MKRDLCYFVTRVLIAGKPGNKNYSRKTETSGRNVFVRVNGRNLLGNMLKKSHHDKYKK